MKKYIEEYEVTCKNTPMTKVFGFRYAKEDEEFLSG